MPQNDDSVCSRTMDTDGNQHIGGMVCKQTNNGRSARVLLDKVDK